MLPMSPSYVPTHSPIPSSARAFLPPLRQCCSGHGPRPCGACSSPASIRYMDNIGRNNHGSHLPCFRASFPTPAGQVSDFHNFLHIVQPGNPRPSEISLTPYLHQYCIVRLHSLTLCMMPMQHPFPRFDTASLRACHIFAAESSQATRVCGQFGNLLGT